MPAATSPGRRWGRDRPPVALFESWRGRYADSPRAISEYLGLHDVAVERLWSVAPGQSAEFPDDVGLVDRHTPGYFWKLATTDLLITNDIVSRHYLSGPGVTYVQCMHGTPLKHIGRDDDLGGYRGARAHHRRMRRDIAKWDALLSPSPAITPILRSAYEYDGVVLETGLPRNDVLSNDVGNVIRDRTRAALGVPPDATVVLYAPTWRDDDTSGAGLVAQSFTPDWTELVAALPDLRILFRAHNNIVAAAPDVPHIIDASGYPDIAELYLAADVLVSDYSSVIYDFAVTGRPIICFAPDLEHYRNDLRGLYFSYEEWAPGPILATTGELVDALADLGAVARSSQERYRRFAADFCSLHDGHATERVVAALGLA